MISGATGALAVIMVSLVLLGNEKGEALGLGSDMGVQYLFAAVILMGIIQIGCGCLKLGVLCAHSTTGYVWICKRIGHRDLRSPVPHVY